MEATDTPVARARGLQLPLAAADGAQIAIFVGCLAGHLAMAVTAFGASLLDAHGFRQTQTAITAASMAAGGPFFRYETPVLGAPFSLPFELPLYQWLSARLSTLGGLPLETAGRLVSEAFFLLTAAALFAALGALGIPRPRRLGFVSILLVSPVYLFWSPTFM